MEEGQQYSAADESPTSGIPVYTSPEQAHVRPPPSGALWLFYLYLRPKRFFQHFVLESSPLLMALAAWIAGLSETIDKIDERMIRAEVSGRPNSMQFLMESWSTYWSMCAALGLLGALLYFKIGGWWYTKRLTFCGEKEPDPTLARRIYLFACQIHAIPTVLYALWETQRYSSPAAAWRADDAGALVILLFPFWSLYTSYRGVRTSFDVRKWAARLWFVFLPALAYVVGMTVLMAGILASLGLFSSRPNLKNVETIDRPGFTLQYPANWDVDTEDEDYDPDHFFQIEPLLADAVVTFMIFEGEIEPKDLAEETLQGMTEDSTVIHREAITTWGAYEGPGYRVRLRSEERTLDGLVFVSAGKAGGFLVIEVVEVGIASKQAPGFELIRRTFRLKGGKLTTEPVH